MLSLLVAERTSDFGDDGADRIGVDAAVLAARCADADKETSVSRIA
jgi:hypothetical protein